MDVNVVSFSSHVLYMIAQVLGFSTGIFLGAISGIAVCLSNNW